MQLDIAQITNPRSNQVVVVVIVGVDPGTNRKSRAVLFIMLGVIQEHYRFKEIAKYLVSHNIETTSCRRLWRFHVQNLFIICTNSVQILYKFCTKSVRDDSTKNIIFRHKSWVINLDWTEIYLAGSNWYKICTKSVQILYKFCS